ncbi:uncharacterized protein LOC132638638 [Lycium barbarum]|uniref:uncharacterized protein LOC132638638 n=1 Tax=Lycium barbarum TaxID=112863 RepID=UPI00293EBC12|nr:uncharacterized protein LOC132638638 [Lycium barbarum]
MFDILFRWRKATKCKNLIKRVTCRLKLLKNKRSCIVKQLRDDLGQLLRHGHYQIVFDRVEQLFMDENMLVVYDLLENFCEFILINLPYIRRHKDCPNEIIEAVSSLIFASARLGDLPELPVIRKLFGERYGKKFETSALELLPGNLVDHQVKENLCIKSVSNEVKYRLVDEIARSCFRQGPLLLEYRNESQQEQANKTILDAQTDHKKDGRKGLNNSNIATKENILSTDYSSAIGHICLDSVHYLKNNEQERVSNSEEMICLGDIEEFESILSKDLNFQDQRLFIFKEPLFPLLLKMDSTNSNMDIIPLQKTRVIAIKDARDHLESQECCSFTFSSSAAMTDLRPRKENQHSYLRTTTMPPERPKDDNFIRSSSFPVQESSPKRYVHPKLPDYDEIAAKFKALKKERLQKKC